MFPEFFLVVSPRLFSVARNLGAFRETRSASTTYTTSANEPTAMSLFTRADALAILKIGETTLFWLQRTGKLKPIVAESIYRMAIRPRAWISALPLVACRSPASATSPETAPATCSGTRARKG